MINKIVSGGQTGVDRAALDVAIHFGIPHGGWCPRGRRAEDGKILPIYQLQETDSSNYAERTEKNVIDSDGTLILHLGPLTGGTLLTSQLAKRWSKPCLAIDLASPADSPGVTMDPNGTDMPLAFDDWIRENGVETLNVAGPRESTAPGIGQMARKFLFSLLDGLNDLESDVNL